MVAASSCIAARSYSLAGFPRRRPIASLPWSQPSYFYDNTARRSFSLQNSLHRFWRFKPLTPAPPQPNPPSSSVEPAADKSSVAAAPTSDDDPLSKVRASKQVHDRLLYERISHHFNQQLEKRVERQGQVYTSTIHSTLSGVQSLLDAERRRALSQAIAQGKATGDWSTLDTLLQSEALPRLWLSNPWIANQFFKAYIYRRDFEAAVQLWRTMRRLQLPIHVSTHCWALLSALKIPSSSTTGSTVNPPSAPSFNPVPRATSVAAAIYHQIQTEDCRPETALQYNIIVDYHLDQGQALEALDIWTTLRSLDALIIPSLPSLPPSPPSLDPDRLIRLLDALCAARRWDLALACFQSDRTVLIPAGLDYYAPPAGVTAGVPTTASSSLSDPKALANLDLQALQVVSEFQAHQHPIESFQLLTRVFDRLYNRTRSGPKAPSPSPTTSYAPPPLPLLLPPHRLLDSLASQFAAARNWALLSPLLDWMTVFAIQVKPEHLAMRSK
ncbi:hypothetical protein H4R33_004450 [Dimargaris cristalligena]|uniref:Uncharacterized protein n=1 Tax=Dimargaris cristalligena TaxID=215637 RepID=A0A4Q0A0Q7_9FUNG|nr:hypothetical protein H4R33_004450 [Dimargaris cristalligena]RKP38700.1 hypothetical protein BJ085DRAFT_36009 [Dimargaris cristalligena]|eukprot:RKP38700.1 hypothetical protein BJ085DRAFT_36009 [Dimargaris cristalligena]